MSTTHPFPPVLATPRPKREPGRFRAVTEDGALLFFDPITGANVRWTSPETAPLRRRLPRVAMFGITNHCNLACGYCSRDVEAASEWTVESAASLLEGLEAHGLLEVAFGGGEPFAFRGFDELVERLGTTTRLALHATTNGTRLTPERLARLRPFLGELRLSIHDDGSWPEAVRTLVDSGIRFGANVLAFPKRLSTLSFLLDQLESLGCKDVALLRPIGDVASREYSAEDEARLAELVARTPLRVRLSACFADRLAGVPRLFEPLTTECAAGDEFFTLTPDRRLLPCSFHSEALPVRSAEDVIVALGRREERFRAPAPRAGCGRRATTPQPRRTGIQAWNAFSSNNSGDCVLVGRFESEADAGRHEGVLAGELVSAHGAPRLAELLAARPSAEGRERLFLRCTTREVAEELARDLGGVAGASRVFVERELVSSRAGSYALRRADTATVLPGGRIALEVAFSRPRGEAPIDAARTNAELRAELGPDGNANLEPRYGTAAGTVETEVPERVLPFLAAFAEARGLGLYVDARPLRPVVEAMGRVAEDLVVLRRR
ncbi:MAG: radical SAM protein [Polyangiales bacterium]